MVPAKWRQCLIGRRFNDTSSGFRAQGSEFRVLGSWLRAQGAEASLCMVHGSWFRAERSEFRVQGSWFMVHGSECRAHISKLKTRARGCTSITANLGLNHVRTHDDSNQRPSLALRGGYRATDIESREVRRHDALEKGLLNLGFWLGQVECRADQRRH